MVGKDACRHARWNARGVSSIILIKAEIVRSCSFDGQVWTGGDKAPGVQRVERRRPKRNVVYVIYEFFG
jgi:hypothetical protein